jgi:hypothetical protein
MSSVGSSYAQISARTKFFLIGASDISGYFVSGLNTVFPVGSSGVASFVTNANSQRLGANTLLKDLGREIVTYLDPLNSGTAGSPHRQVWRQVLPLAAGTTEGVDITSPFLQPVYVLVYDAAGSGVGVSRTG